MRLKEAIIRQIINVQSRRKISEVLDISDQTMYNHLKANIEDGILTKLLTLRAISALTGVPIDELVEDTTQPVVQ